MTGNINLKKRTSIHIIILIGITCAGFLSNRYTGPFMNVLNNKIAGMFYVIFWSLLFTLFSKKEKILLIIFGVLIITCLLEFMQLYSNRWLEMIRSTYLGHALIGSQFSWSDFPYYITGSVISYIILILLHRKRK